MDTARRYYQELDPPVGDQVPDLVQLLHWGIGYQFLDPSSHDPSGDARGDKIHAQTVEQFAYFLYAFPHFKQYFTDNYYQRMYEFAFSHWEKVGLLEVFTEIGELKGRECPGHSIAPNLMMYEVAERHEREDAKVFLDAAIAQAEWFVHTLDPGDPRITRGQRMSEQMPITGLFMLHHLYPEKCPQELQDWLNDWIKYVFQRSDNMYDFRKFDDELWTLPAPWSDPGSVAGFPGITVMMKSMVRDKSKHARLDELKASHFDTLFGRNPVNAASSNKASEAYAGLDRGWPYRYGDDICARLELCRGVLNTIAAHEHYPFNPQARFRHPEGWSAFNAAFNVSLAYTSWDDSRVWFKDTHGAFLKEVSLDEEFTVELRAPADSDHSRRNDVRVTVKIDGKKAEGLNLREVTKSSEIFRAVTSLKKLGVQPGQSVLISYGLEFLEKGGTLTFDQSNGKWLIRSSPVVECN